MVVSRQSAGSKRFGSRSLSNGKSAVLKENFMSIFGWMGFTATYAWMIKSESWSLWVTLLMV